MLSLALSREVRCKVLQGFEVKTIGGKLVEKSGGKKLTEETDRKYWREKMTENINGRNWRKNWRGNLAGNIGWKKFGEKISGKNRLKDDTFEWKGFALRFWIKDGRRVEERRHENTKRRVFKFKWIKHYGSVPFCEC